jgi:hypothetical protein
VSRRYARGIVKLLRIAVPLVLVVALVAIATLVWQSGSVSATRSEPAAPGSATPAPAATPIDAAAVRATLATIPTGGGAVPGYRRDAFGPAWADVDHNGCDTRNDILRRDLVDTAFKPGTHDCVVLSGTLHDPYTGTTVAFTRGAGTSEAVQIDHMVPLALAWQHGASGWTAAQREAFANDPAELLAVDGPANTAKSDSGPSGWLPVASDRCAYVAQFVAVEHAYALTIAAADRTAILTVLAGC